MRLVTPAFAGDPHARECDDEWHDAAGDDLLREEVENRIRAAWGYDLNEVVEVAVEMIRRERRALTEMHDLPTMSVTRQRFVEALREIRQHDDGTWDIPAALRQAIEAFADLRCDGHLNEAYASDDKDYIEQEERHNHANCHAFLLRDCGLDVSDDKRG